MRRVFGLWAAAGLAIGAQLAAPPAVALSLLQPAQITSQIPRPDGTCCIVQNRSVSTVPGSAEAAVSSSTGNSSTRLTFAQQDVDWVFTQIRGRLADYAITESTSRFSVGVANEFELEGEWQVSRGNATGLGIGAELLVSFVDLTTGDIVLLDSRVLEVAPGGETYTIGDGAVGSTEGLLLAGHVYEIRTRFVLTRTPGTFVNASTLGSGTLELKLTQVVPEPSTALLLGGGLGLLARRRSAFV